MTFFDLIGLVLLAEGGVFVAWVGLRNDPRLVRHAWERTVLVVLGVAAWFAASVMLMGVV